MVIKFLKTNIIFVIGVVVSGTLLIFEFDYLLYEITSCDGSFYYQLLYILASFITQTIFVILTLYGGVFHARFALIKSTKEKKDWIIFTISIMLELSILFCYLTIMLLLLPYVEMLKIVGTILICLGTYCYKHHKMHLAINLFCWGASAFLVLIIPNIVQILIS